MNELSRTVIILLLIFLLVSCGPKKIIYDNGTYSGMGQGHHGLIKVKVVTDKYEIKKIKIVEQQETPVLSDIVYEKIPRRVIKENGTDVDVVAGATFTSNGLLEAIENALEKAKNYK